MLFLNDNILSEGQLRRLKEHEYSSGGCTILDSYMQVFWRWLVLQCPLWLAPNLITVIGLFINLLTTLILLAYSPDARQPVSQHSLHCPCFSHFFVR